MSAQRKPQQVVIDLGRVDGGGELFVATISLAGRYDNGEANRILREVCATEPELSVWLEVYGTDVVVIGYTVTAVQERVHLVADTFEVPVETLYRRPMLSPLTRQIADAAHTALFGEGGVTVIEGVPPEKR
jgi:LPS sulfotransferase NodH